jgi:glycosyltransferase involved in cell wall biosynthesis
MTLPPFPVKSMPRFSVVIPCYNRADLVAKAVASVLAQTYADFEIIVVDDGSTDQTPHVLAGFGTQITALRQENAGPGAARNLGISRATGQYIAFLDSDDLWFPWTLATIDRTVREQGAPAVLMGAPVPFHEESDLAQVHSEPVATFRVQGFSDYFASRGERLSVGQGLVFRSEALRSIGGLVNESVNYEDIDLLLRLGDRPGFVHIESPPTFALREHPVSLKSNHQKAYDGMLLLLDREKSGQYPGGAQRKWDRRNIITTHVRVMTLALLRSGWRRRAIDIYLRTFAWHLGMGRWRYLFGFPCLWLAFLRPLRTRQKR